MITIQQTGIRLTAEDKKAIEVIKKHYGVISANAAIRYALRAVIRDIEKQEARKKESEN